MHRHYKQTLCHPADRSVDWRNTGNGGLCWNPELTLKPGEVALRPMMVRSGSLSGWVAMLAVTDRG